MTLERKLQHLQTWNPDKRLNVFEDYHSKCSYKGRDGSSATQRGENLDEFIEYDFKRFVKYVRHWRYYKTLSENNIPTLHHRAQENKLRRYSGGCDPHKFP